MKNTMKLKLLAAAVMMVAGTAHAGTAYVGVPPAALVQQVGTDGSVTTPYDFGVIGTSATVLAVTIGGTPFGSFEEFANFTIPTPSNAVGSANTYTLNLLGINLLEITGLSVEVWDSVHPLGGTLFTTFPGNNATWSIGALAAGQYHLDISGTFGPNAGGGQYSVALQAAPVPEPETYAMFLAGLGLMGFMARRRSKTS